MNSDVVLVIETSDLGFLPAAAGEFRVSDFEFRISGQAENYEFKWLLGSGLSGLGY